MCACFHDVYAAHINRRLNDYDDVEAQHRPPHLTLDDDGGEAHHRPHRWTHGSDDGGSALLPPHWNLVFAVDVVPRPPHPSHVNVAAGEPHPLRPKFLVLVVVMKRVFPRPPQSYYGEHGEVSLPPQVPPP